MHQANSTYDQIADRRRYLLFRVDVNVSTPQKRSDTGSALDAGKVGTPYDI